MSNLSVPAQFCNSEVENGNNRVSGESKVSNGSKRNVSFSEEQHCSFNVVGGPATANIVKKSLDDLDNLLALEAIVKLAKDSRFRRSQVPSLDEDFSSIPVVLFFLQEVLDDNETCKLTARRSFSFVKDMRKDLALAGILCVQKRGWVSERIDSATGTNESNLGDFLLSITINGFNKGLNTCIVGAITHGDGDELNVSLHELGSDVPTWCLLGMLDGGLGSATFQRRTTAGPAISGFVWFGRAVILLGRGVFLWVWHVAA